MMRPYQKDDCRAVQEIYQLAFSGPPWGRPVSGQEAAECWRACLTRRGFECLVAKIEGQVVGFTCFDTPTLEALEQERGAALAAFVRAHCAEQVVWLRETCVRPGFQSQGLARCLKEAAWGQLLRPGWGGLVLTRMRDDNPCIVRINESLGFRRTGIKVPSRRQAGIMHEYWYKVL